MENTPLTHIHATATAFTKRPNGEKDQTRTRGCIGNRIQLHTEYEFYTQTEEMRKTAQLTRMFSERWTHYVLGIEIGHDDDDDDLSDIFSIAFHKRIATAHSPYYSLDFMQIVIHRV